MKSTTVFRSLRLMTVVCALFVMPLSAQEKRVIDEHSEEAHSHETALPVAANPSGTGRPSVLEVSKELINPCLGCGRVALDQSPTCETGKHYRAIVAEQISKGKNKDEIITYFADTYGEQMLGTPRPTGFNQAALLMPLAAVALGMIPIGLALSRRKKNTVSVPLASQSTTENSTNNSAAAAPPEDPRVAAALRDYDF